MNSEGLTLGSVMIHYNATESTLVLAREKNKSNVVIQLATNLSLNHVTGKLTRNVLDHSLQIQYPVDASNPKQSILLTISKAKQRDCVNLEWRSNQALTKSILQDCINLESRKYGSFKSKTWWYGGAEMFRSYYSSTSNHGSQFSQQPFISSDIFGKENKLGGVLEALWLNSDGWSVRVNENMSEFTSPLWASFDTNNQKTNQKSLCLSSDWRSFVSADSHPSNLRSPTMLKYSICSSTDLKEAYHSQIINQISYNKQSPRIDMILNPIWSTWAEFKVGITQSEVLKYAHRIADSGYPHSVLEIDDRWSSKYGDFEFDPVKFPNPEEMVDELHQLGFSVTLWVTPFCDVDAVAYEYGAAHHYWVNMYDPVTDTMSPAQSRWWENNVTGSAVLDVTNNEARQWFINRLLAVKKRYGIEGFKLDAGETIYIPPLSNPNVRYFDETVFLNRSQPLHYTRLYVSMVQELGELCEVRSSWKNQQQSNFVRVMDLDSSWGNDGGIGSVIPRVLLFSTLGYRYALPDMIGGNGYGVGGDLLYRGAPSYDLYIRWLQLNVLLPMQLSIPPWRYENTSHYDTIVTVLRDVFSMRMALSRYLEGAVNESKSTGVPIVRPLWYADPGDPNTFGIDDQYMIGNNVVIAPIVLPNCTSRSVYLPIGLWKKCLVSAVMVGREREVEEIVGRRAVVVENVSLLSPTPCYERVVLQTATRRSGLRG